MWLLMLVLFHGPMQIERMQIVETHWNEKECVASAERAMDVGIPDNSNIGCVYVHGMSSA
jgi:hypothetical protein